MKPASTPPPPAGALFSPHPPPGSLRQGYLLAGLIVLIWSGFIVVSRMAGTGHLTPFDVCGIRMATAALLVLPLWIRSGCPSLLSRRMLVLTATGSLGYTLLVYSGFRLAPAAHGGVLVSGFQPFAVSVCAWLITGEKPGRSRLLGIAIILSGGALLAAGSAGAGAGAAPGDLLLVGSSFCWAAYSVLARHWRMPVLSVTVHVALLAALLYLPVYLLALPKGLAAASVQEILLQALYQGALAAVIQMVIFLRAVEILGPSRMGVLVALVPPLGALAAVPLLGEPLTPAVIGSLLLVSAGVFIGNSQIVERLRKCPM